MLKRLLSAPPKDETIADYTSHLYYFLRPGLTDERANQIVSEAHAHLLDRAEAIAQAENLPHDEAEARAVAAFTPAVTFARRMVESAYETEQSRFWRRAGGMVAVVTFCELLRRVVMNDFVLQSTSYLIVAAMLLAAWCAFQARRAQTRNLIIGGAAASLFALIFCVFCSTSGAPVWTQTSRGSVEWANRHYEAQAERIASDVRLVQTGLQTFQAPNTSAHAVIPAELSGARGMGYRVPDRFLVRGSHYFRKSGELETVPTLGEARARWQADGPKWLAELEHHQMLWERSKPAFLRDEQKSSFGWTTPWLPMVLPNFAGYFILVDVVFSYLGRRFYIKSRAGRKIKRA